MFVSATREVASSCRKVKSAYELIVAHQAGAYPGFFSMKRLGVFILPPGRDASPSQGYSPSLSLPVPIYKPGWKEAQWSPSQAAHDSRR